MELKEQIPLLIELQKLDSNIFALKKRKTEIPVSIKNLEEDFKKETEAFKQIENNYKSIQVKHKDKENDLQVKEDSIKKLQVQLYQLKTNKEYTAMQQQIEGVKADKSVLEDEIIGLLYEIETVNKKADEAKAKLKALENKLNIDKKK